MPNFTHKPPPVFAMQYTGDNAEEIKAAFKVEIQAALDSDYIYVYRKGRMGNIKVKRTNYLLGHNGNISVMGEKEFGERYDAS